MKMEDTADMYIRLSYVTAYTAPSQSLVTGRAGDMMIPWSRSASIMLSMPQ